MNLKCKMVSSCISSVASVVRYGCASYSLQKRIKLNALASSIHLKEKLVSRIFINHVLIVEQVRVSGLLYPTDTACLS